MQDDYDLDLSTGGFEEFDEKDTTVTTIPTTATSKKRNQRSVSFYERVRIHFVECHTDYTDEEYKATWLSSHEMDSIRSCAKSEAGLLDSGVEPTNSTARGLESRTRAGEKLKRGNRLNAYAAVFFEMDSQDQSGFMCEYLIAEAYELYSKPCEKSAREIGKQDATEAMAIYNEGLQDKSSKNDKKKKHTKKPRNNSINLATHFRKTKKRSNGCKPLLTLAPEKGSASSAAAWGILTCQSSNSILY